MSALGYRGDIDGLRAIAVLSVVIYHTGLGWLPGGFVGVDIFFVISGYLITGIIYREVLAKDFSIGRFYVRRIRRILPAFVAMLVAICLTVSFVMLPAQAVDLGKSMIAASAFSTNLLFWQQSGYFTGSAEIKPLLHTWSLSVEEQFYIFFPLLMMWLGRIKKTLLLIILAGMSLFSLVLCEWFLRHDPTFAFYMLPTRAWELMIGSMLAVYLYQAKPALNQRYIWFVLGLVLIFYSIMTLSPQVKFPGLSALPACLGTALVIYAGANYCGKRPLLESSVSLFFGKISYSLYLWHWPVFAIFRYYNIEHLATAQIVSALILSLLLSVMSWRYIETPFRSTNLASTFAIKRPFVFACSFVLMSSAIGGAVIYGQGVPQRFDTATRQLLDDAKYKRRPGCMAGIGQWISPEQACVYPQGAKSYDTALWGDSHSHALIDVLGKKFGANEGVKFFGYSGCAPVPGLMRMGSGARGQCTEYNDAVLSTIKQDHNIKNVIILARHTAYVNGFTSAFGPSEGSGGLEIGFRDMPNIPATQLAQAYCQHLESGVSNIISAGKSVLLVYPVPEVAYDVPTTLALMHIKGQDISGFSRPKSMYDARQSGVRACFDDIATRHPILAVDASSLLCDDKKCSVFYKGKVAYADDDHLNANGATGLADLIYNRLHLSALASHDINKMPLMP